MNKRFCTHGMTITNIPCHAACFCLNGGYGCDNETNNGTCVCPVNYTGEHCEYEICESRKAQQEWSGVYSRSGVSIIIFFLLLFLPSILLVG